jgi:hypothetical protein
MIHRHGDVSNNLIKLLHIAVDQNRSYQNASTPHNPSKTPLSPFICNGRLIHRNAPATGCWRR